MQKITITKAEFLKNLEKYLEDNKSKPSSEKSEAYKNLNRLCEEHNLTAEQVLKRFIEENK